MSIDKLRKNQYNIPEGHGLSGRKINNQKEKIMVTFVKILVKIIKLFIIFDKTSDGAVSDFIRDLEEKYGISEE